MMWLYISFNFLWMLSKVHYLEQILQKTIIVYSIDYYSIITLVFLKV